MKKTRFTESQIVKALKEHEAGRKAEDICRELAISRAAFYKWRSRYGGMEGSDVQRLKELEEENQRLKRMFADLSLDHAILKEVITKKAGALAAESPSPGACLGLRPLGCQGLHAERSFPLEVLLQKPPR